MTVSQSAGSISAETLLRGNRLRLSNFLTLTHAKPLYSPSLSSPIHFPTHTGIQVFRAHDQTELIAIIQMLPLFLKDRAAAAATTAATAPTSSSFPRLGDPPLSPPPHTAAGNKIKLIIVDSLAFHFRASLNDTARARTLSTLAQLLNKCAIDFSLAVVLVNHMTTKVHSSSSSTSAGTGTGTGTGRSSTVVPALGQSRESVS